MRENFCGLCLVAPIAFTSLLSLKKSNEKKYVLYRKYLILYFFLLILIVVLLYLNFKDCKKCQWKK
jgi:hypothetical protein